MKTTDRDDLSVVSIHDAPALWTILPALSYKTQHRCSPGRSKVVRLADCILFAWRQDRLLRAYEQLDRGRPTEDLMRVVTYRVGSAQYHVPDTDMHYAVALQRRGGTVLRVIAECVYDLTPEAFAIDDAGLLWRSCGACTERRRSDGTWEQVWRYDARLVPVFLSLGVGRFR